LVEVKRYSWDQEMKLVKGDCSWVKLSEFFVGCEDKKMNCLELQCSNLVENLVDNLGKGAECYVKGQLVDEAIEDGVTAGVVTVDKAFVVVKDIEGAIFLVDLLETLLVAVVLEVLALDPCQPNSS